MPRDSRNTKTDMQTESLKFFVAYSTTHTTTSTRGRERDEQLAPSIRPFIRSSVCLPQSTQTLKTSKIDLFLLSGICSQALSPQAFQTLPAATCSPAVNGCLAVSCAHASSRGTQPSISVTFLSLTNSPNISFLDVLGHWHQVGELLPTLLMHRHLTRYSRAIDWYGGCVLYMKTLPIPSFLPLLL